MSKIAKHRQRKDLRNQLAKIDDWIITGHGKNYQEWSLRRPLKITKFNDYHIRAYCPQVRLSLKIEKKHYFIILNKQELAKVTQLRLKEI